MKIIEALKELPVLDKRIQKNTEMLVRYASDVDLNVPDERQTFAFKTRDEQQKEVDALRQSVIDLVHRKARLRRALAITNTEVRVTIEGKEQSIAEWIDFREKGVQQILNMLNALNDTNGRNKMGSTQFDPETGIKIVKFYDEKQRNDEIQKWQDIKDKIDGQLEIINATTDLTVNLE